MKRTFQVVGFYMVASACVAGAGYLCFHGAFRAVTGRTI